MVICGLVALPPDMGPSSEGLCLLDERVPAIESKPTSEGFHERDVGSRQACNRTQCRG